MTPQEKVLWRELRGRRFEGFKFRRQMWLAGFIADFACPDAKLVIEADGSQHAEAKGYDDARTVAFARHGWRTLRFWNNEISEDLKAVLSAILNALPSPSHPPGGGRAPPSPQMGEGEAARTAGSSPRTIPRPAAIERPTTARLGRASE